MANKDVAVNGQICRCGADWTVEVAERRIRSRFGLQFGSLEEDGVVLLEGVVIGSLAGSLAFVGGQAIQQAIQQPGKLFFFSSTSASFPVTYTFWWI